MHIFLSCPRCARSIKVRPDFLGKKLKCPKCAEAALMQAQPEKKIYLAVNCDAASEMAENLTRELVQRGYQVWRELVPNDAKLGTGKNATSLVDFAATRNASIEMALCDATAMVVAIGAADFVQATFLEEARCAANAGIPLVVVWAGDPVVFKTKRFAGYVDGNAADSIERVSQALATTTQNKAEDPGASRYRLGLLLGALRLECLGVTLLEESLALRMKALGDDHADTVQCRDLLRILSKGCDQHRSRLASKSAPASPPAVGAPAPAPARATAPVPVDKNVQFTVFRPQAVMPDTWNILLAFAHLAKKRPDAPKHEPDPVAEVQKQAKATLGEKFDHAQKLVQDSMHSVPREGEITFLPNVEGITFNPSRQSFLWLEPVHKVEFRFKAAASLVGDTARGRMTVLLGSVILADVPLVIDVEAELPPDPPPREEVSAQPYRKIFASYSHKDLAVVEHFEKYLALLGDEVLRDWKHLRTGQKWNDRLLQILEEADIFQLFWSSNSMTSEFCRREWEHALKVAQKKGAGVAFIRPVYWEKPMPMQAEPALPPVDLADLHFAHIGVEIKEHEAEAAKRPGRYSSPAPPGADAFGESDSEVSLDLGDDSDADESLDSGELSLGQESDDGVSNDSEFELSLDDSGSLAPEDEEKHEEPKEGDIFESDTDVPLLDETEEDSDQVVSLEEDEPKIEDEDEDHDEAAGVAPMEEDDIGGAIMPLDEAEEDEEVMLPRKKMKPASMTRSRGDDSRRQIWTVAAIIGGLLLLVFLLLKLNGQI